MSRHRRRALIYVALALVCGVAGLWMLGHEAAPVPPTAAATQVVVVQPLPAGAQLTARDLAVARLPARYVPRGAVADPGRCSGSGSPWRSRRALR